MNDRTICRGQEIQRRIEMRKRQKMVGILSTIATFCLIIIACLGKMSGDWI